MDNYEKLKTPYKNTSFSVPYLFTLIIMNYSGQMRKNGIFALPTEDIFKIV